MKKSLLFVLGAAVVLTACDDASQPAPQTQAPAQQVAQPDYKQISAEKAQQSASFAKEAQDKNAQVQALMKIINDKQEEAKTILAQGGDNAEKLAEERNNEITELSNQVIKLSQESQEAAAKADMLAKEAAEASQKSHQ